MKSCSQIPLKLFKSIELQIELQAISFASWLWLGCAWGRHWGWLQQCLGQRLWAAAASTGATARPGAEVAAAARSMAVAGGGGRGDGQWLGRWPGRWLAQWLVCPLGQQRPQQQRAQWQRPGLGLGRNLGGNWGRGWGMGCWGRGWGGGWLGAAAAVAAAAAGTVTARGICWWRSALGIPTWNTASQNHQMSSPPLGSENRKLLTSPPTCKHCVPNKNHNRNATKPFIFQGANGKVCNGYLF